MTHDNAYVRTDDERRADWSRVEQITPDWVPVIARLVQAETSVAELREELHQAVIREGRLKAALKARGAA